MTCSIITITYNNLDGLQRTADSMAAGIPVIANYASVRSFYNCANVYVYQDDSEISVFKE